MSLSLVYEYEGVFFMEKVGTSFYLTPLIFSINVVMKQRFLLYR